MDMVAGVGARVGIVVEGAVVAMAAMAADT
jgi:hypothetical protein